MDLSEKNTTKECVQYDVNMTSNPPARVCVCVLINDYTTVEKNMDQYTLDC